MGKGLNEVKCNKKIHHLKSIVFIGDVHPHISVHEKKKKFYIIISNGL